VVIFAIGSGLFAFGAVMGALLFPSKARLMAMRAAANSAQAPAASEQVTPTEDALAIEH
jgi:hypothetical protein